MPSPNIHRVRLIEERDEIKAQFAAYKAQAQSKCNFYRDALIFAVVIIIILCWLLGVAHG